MQALHKVVNNIVQKNLASDKDYHCLYCSRFVPTKEIEVFGQKRTVQPKCECEVKAKEAELQNLINAGNKREIEKRFAKSSLGKRFADSTFDNFQMRIGAEKAFDLCKKYVSEFHEWGPDSLLIWGDWGNGKSHLGAAIDNALTDKNLIVVFQSVPELLQKIRDTFSNGNGETEREIMRALFSCDLLILDDIGAEKVTDWVSDALFRIIDGRYRKKKPILYTTNLKPTLLLEKLGGRIYDRITETSLPVENKANSFRKEKARERFMRFTDEQGSQS
jgi:DNA replication protein DnaC